MKTKSTAIWAGKGTDGSGSVSTESNILKDLPYSFGARYVSPGKGTSPEELIAAAHAGCFAMKLAFMLENEGFTATELHVNCELEYELGVITKANLFVKAKIAEITEEEFNELVDCSGKNCPVSQLMKAEITVNAELLKDSYLKCA